MYGYNNAARRRTIMKKYHTCHGLDRWLWCTTVNMMKLVFTWKSNVYVSVEPSTVLMRRCKFLIFFALKMLIITLIFSFCVLCILKLFDIFSVFESSIFLSAVVLLEDRTSVSKFYPYAGFFACRRNSDLFSWLFLPAGGFVCPFFFLFALKLRASFAYAYPNSKTFELFELLGVQLLYTPFSSCHFLSAFDCASKSKQPERVSLVTLWPIMCNFRNQRTARRFQLRNFDQ